MLGPNVIFEIMYHEFVAIVGFFIIRVVSEVAASSVIGANSGRLRKGQRCCVAFLIFCVTQAALSRGVTRVVPVAPASVLSTRCHVFCVSVELDQRMHAVCGAMVSCGLQFLSYLCVRWRCQFGLHFTRNALVFD